MAAPDAALTTLLDFQRHFQAWVTGEGLAPPANVAGTGAASAGERLQVYAEAIRLRFLEVLGKDYPGLHALVGEDEFRVLGGAYIVAHPSRERSIRCFGRHLPLFLRGTAPWRERPLLGEMACFEWAKGEVADAADRPVVGVDEIAAVPPGRWADLRPRLKPALRRLALEWNVPALWSALDRGDPPPPPARSERALPWLLWRDGLRVRWRSLGPDEAWAIRACSAGEDFGAICTGFCERGGEEGAALRAATCLRQWAADGLLEAL